MSDPGPVVFVVDDDASVRKSLARLLRAEGYEPETFGSAEEFLQNAPHKGSGCIILDVRMPGKSGMQLQEDLGSASSSLPIIFITGHGSLPMGVHAMKKGAIDFLSKPFDEGQLLDTVRTAIEKSRRAMADRAEQDAVKGKVNLLTKREREILHHVITGMPNREIAFSLGIAEQTVKIHRSHIMEKLGAHSVAELVRFADKAGFVPLQNEFL
jgi:FixJ family two-component response regulator